LKECTVSPPKVNPFTWETIRRRTPGHFPRVMILDDPDAAGWASVICKTSTAVIFILFMFT
jgi:hypothetical protein